MPSHSEAFATEWRDILSKVKGLPTIEHGGTEVEVTDDCKEELEFHLNSFVPLSEVKHTAPPDWVSVESDLLKECRECRECRSLEAPILI